MVNPFQRFLAHRDAPEVWEEDVLVAGGKHYGHLEVDVLPLEDGRWQAVLKPVYIFPRFAPGGAYEGFERRLYDDIVTLTTEPATAVAAGPTALPDRFFLAQPYPNPFNSTVLLRYALIAEVPVQLQVYNALGQPVRTLVRGTQAPGYYSAEWDGRDRDGAPVTSGIYLIALRAGAHSDTAKVSLVR